MELGGSECKLCALQLLKLLDGSEFREGGFCESDSGGQAIDPWFGRGSRAAGSSFCLKPVLQSGLVAKLVPKSESIRAGAAYFYRDVIKEGITHT